MDINQKIIEMIIKESSINEIAKATNLSNKQLFYRLSLLKLKGYDFIRKYYANGQIVYKLKKEINCEKSDNFKIITRPDDKTFKAILISDLHISNDEERLDLLERVYDYCIKEDIHIIINAGDFVDGFVGLSPKKYLTAQEQIEYLLKVHPFDKNIINFVCLGNHDYSLLQQDGQDLAIVLQNRRHDIVPIGYGYGIIEIKNDRILVKHKCVNRKVDFDCSNMLILTGHQHKMKTTVAGDYTVEIVLPSLSNIMLDKKCQILPSMVKMTLNFNQGYFNTGYFEHLLMGEKIYKVSESLYSLYNGKIAYENIKNEEERDFDNNRVKIHTL